MLSSKFEDIQRKTQSLYENERDVGLKINIRKSKVMRLNCNIRDQINIDTFEDVETFTYLRAVVTPKGRCDENIASRLSQAKFQFRRLRKNGII